MTMESLKIESRAGRRAGQRILSVSGPLDINTELKFLEQIRTETAPVVILDLTSVDSFDSRAIAAVVQLHNTFKRENRRLALVGLSPRIQHALEITRILPVLTVFATHTEAEDVLV